MSDQRKGHYTISKWFTFEAAHRLAGLPESHKCSRPHGHSYKVEWTLAGYELEQETGFLLDFGAVSKFVKQMEDLLDHQDLNKVLPFNPTAECIARFIFEALSQYLFSIEVKPEEVWPVRVTVWETRKCSASWGIG